MALSGGHTPETLFRALASQEFRAQVDWGRVELFWGDERAVPPESKESNYGMARRELLIRVPIPGGNVHRMEAETGQTSGALRRIMRICCAKNCRWIRADFRASI